MAVRFTLLDGFDGGLVATSNSYYSTSLNMALMDVGASSDKEISDLLIGNTFSVGGGRRVSGAVF